MENTLQSTWVLERVVIGGMIRLQTGISTIGRNPTCSITVASNYVSRNHAEFYVFPGNDHIQVKDLGSTNGIFINGTQIAQGLCNLQEGDRIGIGVSVDNDDITENHPIFILRQTPLAADNNLLTENGYETDLEVILNSPEVKRDLENENSEGIVISDSDCDEDDGEDDFVQPEDVDDNELANDILMPAVSPFKAYIPSNSNLVENIKSIFGNLNTEMLKNLPINIAVATTVQKSEEDDVVYISSDDESDDDQGKEFKSPQLFGKLFTKDVVENKEQSAEASHSVESLTNLKTSKSVKIEEPVILPDICKPSTSSELTKKSSNILDSCKSVEPVKPSASSTALDLSKTSELPKPCETMKTLEPLATAESSKPLGISASAVYDDGADEEEELIFTQKLLDEAREELSDSDSEESPAFNVSEQGVFILPPIDQKQSLPNKNEVINLDDDDEYDEAFESKVNSWSLKLSQSFSNNFNLSQIYEDDIDSVPTVKTENIFINDENEERTAGSDEASKNYVDKFAKEGGDAVEDKHQITDADIFESVLVQQWKRSSSRNFLFSSSSSDEGEDESSCTKSTSIKAKVTSRDKKRERKVSGPEEVPKKRTKENEEDITTVDERNKKKTTIQNASSKQVKERVRLKSSDTQKRQDVQREDNAADKRRKSSDSLATLNRSASVPERRNSCNYMSAKFARSVSTGNHSFIEELDQDFEELREEKESEKDNEPEPLVEPMAEPEQQPKPKQQSSVSNLMNRKPPMIITPPPMPVNKGKLRGVSAVLRKSVDIIKDIQVQKDLKRKFIEKPSIARRKAELISKEIKEDRKQKLKDLANKKSSEAENVKENNVNKNENRKTEKPKVKVTSVNRGAFLTETTVKPYKIPKKNTKPMPSSSSELLPKIPVATAVNSTSSTAKTTSSTNEKKSVKEPTVTNFSQELLKADAVILNKPSTSTAFRERQKSVDAPADQKQRAPPRRNSKKLTFEAMTIHFEETARANEIQSKLAAKAKPSNLKSPVGKPKKKKTVRFNDVPQIRYIERVVRAVRKADQKEPTTFRERKNFIRRRFPIVDHTDELLNDVLTWSHDWLQNKEQRSIKSDQSDNIVYPMTDQFKSIEQYKSIIFPLLKMEYFAHLERHMEKHASHQGYKVSIDHFSQYKNRELVYAKCSTRIEQSQLGNTDLALVNIVINTSLNQCLAYISNIRKNDKWSLITMEVMQNAIPKDKWKNASQITIKRVIEGVRVLFGSFNAVHQLSQTPLFQKILNPLELLNVKNNWHPSIEYIGCDAMNSEQKDILLRTYAKAIDECNPNISLIEGPPGTGKSRLITNLTLQLLYGNEIPHLDRKVLICAQSNMAVDVIARQLYHIQKKLSPRAQKYQVIRFGKEERVHKDLVDITLSRLIQKDQRARLQRKYESNQAVAMSENLSEEIQKLEMKIAALEKENLKDVRQDELIELRKNLSLKKSIQNQTLRPEDEKKLYPQYLENANVVCTTLSSCVKLSHYIDYFDVCIIDEATQCVEPWTIMPLKFGVNSLIMVGDTQQLPATVLSQKAKDYGLATSLFTRIQKCLESTKTDQPSPIFSLHTQYRMHPEICKWPNMYFYKNELLNSPTTAEFKSMMKPFSILNLDYRQNAGCHSGQISNSLEAKFVAKLVKALDAYIPNKFFSYGIITPYAQHREKLESMIRSDGVTNIMVNTIDSYQGIEKDVIIISNARTQGVGFLSNYQRLNVALTRPKKCLILCGNFKNLEAVPSWASLLTNARERGLLHDISADEALQIDNVIEKIKIKR